MACPRTRHRSTFRHDGGSHIVFTIFLHAMEEPVLCSQFSWHSASLYFAVIEANVNSSLRHRLFRISLAKSIILIFRYPVQSLILRVPIFRSSVSSDLSSVFKFISILARNSVQTFMLVEKRHFSHLCTSFASKTASLTQKRSLKYLCDSEMRAAFVCDFFFPPASQFQGTSNELLGPWIWGR